MNWLFVLPAAGGFLSALVLLFTLRFNKSQKRAEMHLRINKILDDKNMLHHAVVLNAESVTDLIKLEEDERIRKQQYMEVTSYYSLLESVATHYRNRIFSLRQLNDYFGDRFVELSESRFHKAMKSESFFFERHQRVFRMCRLLAKYRSIKNDDDATFAIFFLHAKLLFTRLPN